MLALGCALAGLLCGTAQAQSYYETGQPHRMGSGGASFGGVDNVSASVDVATGAVGVHMPLSTIPGLVPIVGGWIFTSQDGSAGPVGTGSALPYDFFVVTASGGGYELIAPGNRHFSFTTQSGGNWINTRDPEALGATLQLSGGGLMGTLRWKTGETFGFDSSGNLISVKDRFGNQITITRNTQGYPLQISQSGTRFESFTYDPNTKLLNTVTFQYEPPPGAQPQQDPVNRTWTFAYGTTGTLTTLQSVKDPENEIWLYGWTTYPRAGDGKVLPLIQSITNPRGTVAFSVPTGQYDTSGRVKTITFGDSSSLTATYSAAIGSTGYTSITDPTGDTYQWNYTWNTDSTGYLITSTTNPLSRVTTFARALSPTNLITSITDFRNRVTSLGWNSANGNLTSVTRPTNSGGMATWTATYDPTWNQLTSLAEPPPDSTHSGPVTTFQVDPGTGNTIAVTDARVNTTNFVYNPDGTLWKSTDALGQTTEYSYDGAGDTLTVTDPLGHMWAYGYDQACRLTSATDANGKQTQFQYDLMDRLKMKMQTLNGSTVATMLQYDPDGDLHFLTDANNNKWEWDYDNLDRLQKEINPLSQSIKYVWNPSSTDLTITDRLNQTLDYQFGPTGRLKQATFKLANGTTESGYAATYDPNTDLLSQVADQDGTGANIRTFAFGYDNIYRLQTETRTEGSSTWTNTYAYDDLDRRITYTAYGQSPVSYGYDPTDNIISISQMQNGVNRVFSFEYDCLGRLRQRLLPNGVTTVWSYDPAGFLYQVDSQRYGVSFDTHGYSQSDGMGDTLVGQILEESVRRDPENGNPAETSTNSFSYDDLYRLKEATVEGTYYTWEYDNVGNRMAQTVGSTVTGVTSTSYSYDNANRLTAAGGASVGSDYNGNLTSYNGNTYAWDVRGRLASITGPSLTASFSYDYRDRRSSKTVNGSTWSLREDGDDLVYDNGPNGARFTLQGPLLDEPLADFEPTFPNGLYLTPNHLGSTTTLTGPSGYLQNWYFYQPFGTASVSNSSFATWSPLRFTGREDDGTGLDFYRSRYYSPDLGRFISEDPAGLDGAGNQYAYAGNDPIDFNDAYGRSGAAIALSWGGRALAASGEATPAGWVAIGGAAATVGAYYLGRTVAPMIFPLQAGLASPASQFTVRRPAHIGGGHGGSWGLPNFNPQNPDPNQLTRLVYKLTQFAAAGQAAIFNGNRNWAYFVWSYYGELQEAFFHGPSGRFVIVAGTEITNGWRFAATPTETAFEQAVEFFTDPARGFAKDEVIRRLTQAGFH